jgi:hypothetical protein
MSLPPIAAEARTRTIPMLSIADLEALPAPEWQIDGMWQSNTLMVFYGETNTGKSFVALDWAFCFAAGKPWQGRDVKPGVVVYIYAEGRQNLGPRIAACMAAHDLTKSDLEGRIFFVPEAVDFMEDDGADVQLLVEKIRKKTSEQIGAIFIDTLARSFGTADENVTKDMNLYVTRLDYLKNLFGATVIPIHHTGHNNDRERGNKALRSAADTMLSLRRASSGSGMTLKCEKQKDGPTDWTINLRLVEVPEVGSCFVASDTEGSSFNGHRPLSSEQLTCLAALHDFGEQGATSTEWKTSAGKAETGGSTFYKWIAMFEKEEYVRKDGEGKGARYYVTDSASSLWNKKAA